MAAELYVKRAKRNFDIVFLDPPFPYQYKWELLDAIVASVLVSNESRILIHRPREDCQTKSIAFLEKKDSREYGRSVVDFFFCNKCTKA